MISKYRNSSKSIVSILATPFILLGFTPLAVTLLSLPFAILFLLSIIHGNFLFAFFFGVLALMMDAIDGTVAKKCGSVSLFGNYIDAVVDKVIDFILISSFVFYFPVETVITLGCSFLASYAKPRVALVIATDNRDWPGIGERGDKMVILLSGVLLAVFFGVLIMRPVLWLVTTVAVVGFFQRISYARRLIKEKEVFLDR